MAQPFNYELGVKSPMEAQQAAYQGQLKTLATEAEMQRGMAQAIAERQRAQQAAEREARKQAAFERLRQPNPTALDYQAAALLGNKDEAELIMKFASQADAEQKRALLGKVWPVAAALSVDRPEKAIANLERQREALKDNPVAVAEIDQRIQGIKADPEAAFAEIAGYVSLIDKDAMDNLLKVTKEQREASQERRATAKDIRDAEMQGWNIKKIQNDIGVSRLNAQIAAANAAASREGNTLKQQELLLKVQEMTDKRDQAVKSRIAEGESVVSSLQNTKALLSDILSKENRSALQTAVGSSAFLAMTPGTQARTIAGKIEQLQNAVAAVNLDKLKGAMSDKDILFLKNIESNLDRYQDEAAFIRELNRISASLDQGINRAAIKYGMPEFQPQPSARTPAQVAPRQPTTRNVTVDY